jgi:hypothetical protein
MTTSAELGDRATSTTGRLGNIVVIVSKWLGNGNEADLASRHLKATRAFLLLPKT